MSNKWSEIAQNIKRLYNNQEFIPLHEPTFNEREVQLVTDCIETGWVSSVGKYVNQFEKMLAEYTGVKHAVAVMNGTSALHIALKIVGVQANDEVFIPSLTFVATANAVSYLQAIPHFVDVSKETLGMDPVKLEAYILEIGQMENGQLINKQTGRIIRAAVPMHTFGHSVDIDPLMEVCERYNIVIVEDAAESLGTFYKGKHTGGFGLVGSLSFNGNKIVTTGGGGAILTNDEFIAHYAKHITTTAKIPHRWEYRHDVIGYNYRMPNINAALGCAQLEKMDKFLSSKRMLAEQYQKLFNNMTGVEFFTEPEFSKSNYWLQTILIDPQIHNRNEILETLNDEGLMSRPVWIPIHELEPYLNCPKSDLYVTDGLNKRIINIPSTPLRGI